MYIMPTTYWLLTDGLDRALACAGIGLGALATNGETAHVAHTTDTADRREALQVGSALPAKVTLADVLLVGDDGCELVHFLFAKVAGTTVRIETGFGDDCLCACWPNAVDIA